MFALTSAPGCSYTNTCQRWLVDKGKDDEGMIVLADLHGGDLNGTVARAEFNEIKDKVVAEVCSLFLPCLLVAY